MYTSIFLMLVGMIVYQILSIPLEMTYYILADRPELKGTDALKESIEMMQGNFGRYLMLKISFIPLMFLSVFTFYIALLWVLPYMIMTETMFYRDLTGELTAQKQEEGRNAQEFVNPMFGGTFGENQQNQQQFWSVTGDSSVASDENKEVQNNAASENTQDSLYGSVENNRTTQDNPYDSSESKEVQDSLQSQTTPEEEEDNEPKPWDEYFNSLK